MFQSCLFVSSCSIQLHLASLLIHFSLMLRQPAYLPPPRQYPLQLWRVFSGCEVGHDMNILQLCFVTFGAGWTIQTVWRGCSWKDVCCFHSTLTQTSQKKVCSSLRAAFFLPPFPPYFLAPLKREAGVRQAGMAGRQGQAEDKRQNRRTLLKTSSAPNHSVAIPSLYCPSLPMNLVCVWDRIGQGQDMGRTRRRICLMPATSLFFSWATYVALYCRHQ